jgi:predicted ATPase/class 3 adenylate cyclase
MVRQVYKYWGDVLMFAGDALICLFEEKEDDEIIWDEMGERTLNNEEKAKRRVRDCCLSVMGKIAMETDFTIHGGASHGTIRCFFLGTPSKIPGRCAFVVSGHPLKQTGQLMNKAGKGEVYLDGEEEPITQKEGVAFVTMMDSEDEEEDLGMSLASVYPRESARLKEQEVTLEAMGGFEVNAHARAYLRTLAARRCDAGSQNAMSMLQNELRPVAIVFVGLHDLDDIDPRDSSLLQLMNEAFKILSRITQACNGAVRDMLFDDKGCVFISVFGAHSHEVNPCFDATVSAMRMESALKDINLKRFSLGVSFGECFCGEVGPPVRSDYVVMGPEVNMAARLMGKAPNRGTLVSKRIFTHSKKFIRFVKSEEIQVKGKDGFFHAYIPQTRIERQSLEIAEPQQPFVNMPSRQHAMNSLLAVKAKAQNSEPTIAFVSGGPFLGKSRLIDEVAANATNDGFRVLKSFRTSLDSFTSYFPLRQIVSEAMISCANLKSCDDTVIDNESEAANFLVDENIFNKTDRVNIGSIVPSVADAQLLSLLSGLNPKARTRSIADSLMKILTLLQPLIIILEGDGDIDPSSWSLLAELMHRASKECPQMMLIVSSRDSPTITSAAANLRRNAIQIKLLPFEKYETEQYLRTMLCTNDSDTAIDDRLLDVVHDRSNGCPLFIDCVVKWAVEKHMIEYVDCVDGSKKMSLKTIDERSDDVTAAIPRELSSILLAPFNHLSPPLWDALKIASCIGYSFDAELYSSLNRVLDFMPKVQELAEKHECFEKNGHQFRWKQQAVYEVVKSLLMVNQRQKIHRMIVRAFKDNKVDLEAEDMKRGDIHRLLGRHCALAEDWNGAFEQYMNAGDRAKATFNFNEASKMYEEAIDFQARINEQPPLRLRIIPSINLGTCLRELARYKEAEAILTRCLSEAKTANSGVAMDEQLFVRALTSLAALYQAQSKYAAAKKLYEIAVPIAQNIQESKSSLWLADNIAGYAETLRKSGDLPQAESHHREALEIRTLAVKEKSCTELELAVSYTQLGCTLAGMRQYEEAYEQHRLALKLRYRYLDFSHGLVSESLNYCAESLCALGRGGEGIPLALHAVEIRRNVFGESHPAFAHALSVLASCFHAVGRSFDARDCLEKCLEICEIAFQKNHANLIPNLMNYGNVLRSTGDLKKARDVYQRAIAIHELNFKEGQQAKQLEKCFSEVADLTSKLEQPDSNQAIPTPVLRSQISLTPVDIESDGTPVIVFTDIGRDVDDELALVLMSALRRIHILNPIAVIATLTPQHERAFLARGSMDALGMADVPVGIGSAGGVTGDIEVEVYDADYSRASPSIYENGMELVYRALESVPERSAQLLCMASLSDVATLIRDQEDLFTSKVKEVVLMGGVVSLDSEILTPDSAYNNNCDISSARFVYKRCQELKIPTATLSRWAAYGCPIPPKLLDDLSKTEHMVSLNVRSVSKLGIDQLWNKVILHPTDPRREMLPSRCDMNWFRRVFMDKSEINQEWPSSVWSLVTKLNMYDPLAVLLCVPAYRTAHFNWQTKVVNDVPHIVVGTSELDTGIRNRLSLFSEYSSLFFSAFLDSLHK